MPAKKKTTAKTIELSVKPPVEEDNFSVVLTVEEMFSLVQILSFSKEIFEKMSENCHQDGDEKATQVFSARSKLSLMLYEKLKAVAGIGEPTSREVH